MTSAVQISCKLADGTIVVVGGADVDEFEKNIVNLLGTEDGQRLIVKTCEALTAVSQSGVKLEESSWQRGSHNRAVNRVAEQAGGEVVSDAGASGIVKDRWGKKWNYDQTGNDCKHGPRVHMSGIAKSGRAYQAWACPVGGPQWQGDRSGKCDMVFDD